MVPEGLVDLQTFVTGKLVLLGNADRGDESHDESLRFFSDLHLRA